MFVYPSYFEEGVNKDHWNVVCYMNGQFDFDKIIVKISFPNQAFADFNVAMKKPCLRRVTWDLNSSVLWLTSSGWVPRQNFSSFASSLNHLSFSPQVHHVLESFDSSNSPYDKNYLNSRFIQMWGNVRSVILSHDPYDPAHAIPYKTITRAACIGPDGLTWAGPEKGRQALHSQCFVAKS